MMARRSAMWIALASAGSLATAGRADGAVRVHERLHATSHAPRARGSAKLTVKKGSKGTFSVAARRLAGGQSFDVVVGGLKAGTLETNAHGGGKIVFGAPKRGDRALLGFDPRGRSLAVRDHDGHDVLDGEMPDGDDAKVACCLQDDDGVECDDRTPEDCMEDGGTPSSASGCFPDPCGATGGTSVCCTVDSTCGAFVDDDPQVGCHTGVSAAECAERHGTVVEATSCDPNPCAAFPPVELVTCCVPHEDEVECEFRTAERCAEKGGTVSTATSCDPDPCGGSSDDGSSVSNDDHQGDDDDQGDDSHDDDSSDAHCGHHDHGSGDDDSQGEDD